MTTPPPPMIDSAKLLEYAILDSSVSFTGRQTIYVDGTLLGSVPRLTICQNLADTEMHLMLCDENWNVIGASGGHTLTEIKERAERWYSGLGGKWIASPYSLEDFHRYIESTRGDCRCLFCLRWNWEYDQLFTSHGVMICDICVRSFYSVLSKQIPE